MTAQGEASTSEQQVVAPGDPYAALARRLENAVSRALLEHERLQQEEETEWQRRRDDVAAESAVLSESRIALEAFKSNVDAYRAGAAASAKRVPKSGRIWTWVHERATTSAPVDESIFSPHLDAEDLEIWAELQKGEDNVDDEAFARAKNWLAGITALIGLIATASVLSPPDAADLSAARVPTVVVLAVLAFLMLGVGVLRASQAAYGTPGAVELLHAQRGVQGVQSNLRYRLALRKQEIAKASGTKLRQAVLFTLLGIACALAGNVVTWLPPTDPTSPTSVCVVVGTTKVLKVAGSDLAVQPLEGATGTVQPCG